MFLDSGHLQYERTRPHMEQKYMNSDKAQWKEPELTALISKVVCGTNIQSKKAHVLQCKSQLKTWVMPEEPESALGKPTVPLRQQLELH